MVNDMEPERGNDPHSKSKGRTRRQNSTPLQKTEWAQQKRKALIENRSAFPPRQPRKRWTQNKPAGDAKMKLGQWKIGVRH
jgi:hypothetical protein